MRPFKNVLLEFYIRPVILAKDGSAEIHVVNIRALLGEILKTVDGFNPSFMKEIFVSKVVSYSLRDTDLLVLPESNTVFMEQSPQLFEEG